MIHKTTRIMQCILIFVIILNYPSEVNNEFAEIPLDSTNKFLDRDHLAKFPEIQPRGQSSPPNYAIQPFQTLKIMFIVGNPIVLDSILDEPFNHTLVQRGITVIIHDDNNSYQTDGYDAVIISDSINEVGRVDSLYDRTIPILTMEAGTFDEFNLGATADQSAAQGTTFYINHTSHFITNELSVGSYLIYNQSNYLSVMKDYSKIPVGCEIESLARQQFAFKKETTLAVLEKGANDWGNDGTPSPAAERRAFWGASRGAYLTESGWALWNKTLDWILYDDQLGTASISVEVQDKNGWVISNAKVTLTNNSGFLTEFTNGNGIVTFSNRIFGSYNITVEFNSVVNNSLTSLNISGIVAYDLVEDFSFSVIMNLYLETIPPVIFDVHYMNDSGEETFYANVSDISHPIEVILSLKAIDTENFDQTLINDNFSMRILVGERYYNDTALSTLLKTSGVVLHYNISAIDAAGYKSVSETFSITLDDINPPVIEDFGAMDNGDGTVEFYAVITDVSGVQDPVILNISNSLVDIYKNSSGIWTYTAQAFVEIELEYSIFSALDEVGNEASSGILTITPHDLTPPHIWSVIDTLATHDQGEVNFQCYIDDWNEYQSGLNISSVVILISINNQPNQTYAMEKIGEISYDFDTIFNYGEEISYWIQAFDLAGNEAITSELGQILIGDNEIPIVHYFAFDWGNGSVDFYAEVLDWPSNETSANVLFSQNWFDVWQNESMDQINATYFVYRNPVPFGYLMRNVWYRVMASDSAGNTFNPIKEQSFNLTLTDSISPMVIIEIINSTIIDGEFSVIAYATDAYGSAPLVNNTFWAEITTDITFQSSEMDYFPIYRYITSFASMFGKIVNVTIWVSDDAGNLGKITKFFTIGDYAPPNIVQYGVYDLQNGSVVIWAEVKESELGSGLPEDNSTIVIEYSFINQFIVNMKWNGSGNFFEYRISGFSPRNAFGYRISATDRENNLNITAWNNFLIKDLTPPVCYNYGIIETQINHSLSHVAVWGDIQDNFGTISFVLLNLTGYNGTNWINASFEMHYNGTLFLSIGMILVCNSTFEYSILASDSYSNITTSLTNFTTWDFQPAVLRDSGVDIIMKESGLISIWASIEDQFMAYTLIISVYDNETETWIIQDSIMKWNGSHNIINISFEKETNITFSLILYDSGVLGNYYESQQDTKYFEIIDYWPPVVAKTIAKQSGSTMEVWVTILDWGTGVDNDSVFIIYEFVSPGGTGSTVLFEREKMNPINKTTFYVAIKEIPSGVHFHWNIEVADIKGNLRLGSLENPFISELILPTIFGFNFIDIILAVIGTALALGAVTIGGFSIQRNRSRKKQILESYIQQLNFISDIYTILVSTDAGVPIITVTNTMYQRSQDLEEVISGVSTGIDSFLESFQADFMGQMHERGNQPTSDQPIRISLIEQKNVQILIAASPTYRIFAFLKSVPPNFARGLFNLAINDLEDNLTLYDIGIVNQRIVGPQVFDILSKYIPLPLLTPFKINLYNLKEQSELFDQRGTAFVSKEVLNALKRFVIVRSRSLIPSSSPSQEIKQFDEALAKNEIDYNTVYLFSDAREIFTKLLHYPPSIIFEALWRTCHSDVKIIYSTYEFR